MTTDLSVLFAALNVSNPRKRENAAVALRDHLESGAELDDTAVASLLVALRHPDRSVQYALLSGIKQHDALLLHEDVQGALKQLETQARLRPNPDQNLFNMLSRIQLRINDIQRPEPETKPVRRKSRRKTMRDQIFISYSHKDTNWKNDLLTMLNPLIRSDAIKVWTDSELKPGQRWHKVISDALSRAKIGVLLVSADFLSSNYINDVELDAFYQAEKNGEATIFWVAVKPSLVKSTPIAKFQCANDPSKPLSTIQPKAKREQELQRIAEKLAAAYNA